MYPNPFKRHLRIVPSPKRSAEIIRLADRGNPKRLAGFRQVNDREGRFLALEPVWIRVSGELRSRLRTLAGESAQ